MCGIAGVIGADSRTARDRLVRSMLQMIHHRGSEPPNVTSLGDSTFGCVRLPIVARRDLTQPALRRGQEAMAVHNGEIYNYCDVARSLGCLGIRGDTDVLVHLSVESEPSRILQGMYAFAWCDAQGRALVARDPIGIKPLFTARGPVGELAFASERKGLNVEELSGWERRELVPGQLLRRVDRHWSVEQGARPWKYRHAEEYPDQKAACVALRNAVVGAVRAQMPPDLPVAVLCSGGVDSAILTVIAREVGRESGRPKEIVAYVAGRQDSEDVRAAEHLCREVDVPLRTVVLTDSDLRDEVDRVVYHSESFELNVVRNSLITNVLFRRMHQDGCRVALCGEGADELFFGYGDFAECEDEDDQSGLMIALLDDLYRTQLLRVDRTSMRHLVETRVPYLAEGVIDCALRIKPEFKGERVDGAWRGKTVLRLAFEGEVPNLDRVKTSLSCGAGFGGLSEKDESLKEFARQEVGRSLAAEYRQLYPDLALGTFEEVLYLRHYLRYFDVPEGYSRPRFAVRELA